MNKAAAVIITNDKDEVLLFQRGPKARSQQGKWESCGGAVEENETPENAAIREYKEEAGADIEIIELLFKDQDDDGWEGFIYKGRLLTQPSIQDRDIVSAMKWFAREDLKHVDFTTYARRDFEKLAWI